ncbi:restriction endonuclease subunit S [archaeon]|nr:restriction endonuclease subunit S [archaeon]
MKYKISSFLTERQDRFKPAEANDLGLKRLHKIDFSGNIHIVEKPTNTNMILVKAGDLVISGINVEKGAVAVYQKNEDILATIHYSSYEFDKNRIDIDYFKWFLKSDAFKKAILTQTKGGIKTELKPKKFLPLEIDLPDIGVQKQILKKIQSIENEIKQLENISQKDQTLLKKLKQSILSEAVQGKLVIQDPEDESAEILLKKTEKEKEKLVKEKKIRKERPLPGITKEETPYELPKGWIWCRIGEVGNPTESSIVDGPFGSSINVKNDYVDRGIPVIRMLNIKPYNFLEENMKYILPDKFYKLRRHNVIPGDVLFAKVGAGIGETCILPSNFSEGMLSTTGVCRFRVGKTVIPEYLLYFLSSYRNKFVKMASTTAQPFLNMSTIKKVLFPLPPLAEQKRIVKKVNNLMKLCDELENKINQNKIHAEKLMDSILREVFESQA